MKARGFTAEATDEKWNLFSDSLTYDQVRGFTTVVWLYQRNKALRVLPLKTEIFFHFDFH